MPCIRVWIFCATALVATAGVVASQVAPETSARNESIGNEVQLALDRGFEFVIARQNPDSSWGQGGERWWPTSLILLGWSVSEKSDRSPSMQARVRGLAAIRSRISTPEVELRTLEFATAWLALERAQVSADEELLRKSAARLMSRQIRSDGPGSGGFDVRMQGEPDAIHLARLEDFPFILLALRKGELLSGREKEAEACLARAQHFVRSCADAGIPGAYFSQPLQRAGASKPSSSLGSTSAGLFSLLQERGSSSAIPESRSALNWVADHYQGKMPGNSLDELLLAMALDAGHVSELELRGGGKADWARDLAEKAINAQNSDGSWPADSDARAPQGSITSTACRLLMLQIIRRSL